MLRNDYLIACMVLWSIDSKFEPKTWLCVCSWPALKLEKKNPLCDSHCLLAGINIYTYKYLSVYNMEDFF